MVGLAGCFVQGMVSGVKGERRGDVLVDADVDGVLVLFCCVFIDGEGMVVLVLGWMQRVG